MGGGARKGPFHISPACGIQKSGVPPITLFFFPKIGNEHPEFDERRARMELSAHPFHLGVVSLHAFPPLKSSRNIRFCIKLFQYPPNQFNGSSANPQDEQRHVSLTRDLTQCETEKKLHEPGYPIDATDHKL